jgi:transposase
MDARQAKGYALAANAEIVREGNVWIVPSESSSKKYITDLFLGTCTCPDFEKHRVKCKHLHAVDYLVRKESNLPLPAPVKAKRPTYKQQWHQYNLSQTREAAYFKALLYELCATVIEPEKPRGRGRPPAPLSDLIYAASVKIYNCMSGRRNQSDLDEALRRGYLSRRVRYNTIFKYLESEVMTPYLHQLIATSSLVLQDVEVDFAVDSSGFGTCQYRRWFDVKYGNTEDWHDWVKLHLITGVKTNIVASCIVTRRYDNDSPYFKPLVTQAAASGFKLREVSADKEYLSRNNLRLVLMKGGQPYIPFKSNSKSSPKDTVWNRMLHFYRYNQEEFNTHYHKRSNAESTFSMIKARFGERLRCKTEQAQVNEALLKVLSHNICVVIQSMHELGVEAEFIGKMGVCLQNDPI